MSFIEYRKMDIRINEESRMIQLEFHLKKPIPDPSGRDRVLESHTVTLALEGAEKILEESVPLLENAVQHLRSLEK